MSSPSNGGRPVNRQYSVAPSEQTSDPRPLTVELAGGLFGAHVGRRAQGTARQGLG